MSLEIPLTLPLARYSLNRDFLNRDAESIQELVTQSSNTKVLVINNQRTLVSKSGLLRFASINELVDTENLIYLGKDDETDEVFTLRILGENSASSFESETEGWQTLRSAGAKLSSREASIFAQGLALANWHEKHDHCPACGSKTVVIKGGWVRRCEKDGQELFPRTDPAVIVSVIDSSDRILLGSQVTWEENRFSVLAGFVEPGESLEAAVVREVFEEAGITVANPKYLGSQTWPFPYSLMLGFTAEHVSGDLKPDGEELENLRWFTREELQAEAPELLLPGKLSIARAMIEHWLGEELVAGE